MPSKLNELLVIKTGNSYTPFVSMLDKNETYSKSKPVSKWWGVPLSMYGVPENELYRELQAYLSRFSVEKYAKKRAAHDDNGAVLRDVINERLILPMTVEEFLEDQPEIAGISCYADLKDRESGAIEGSAGTTAKDTGAFADWITRANKLRARQSDSQVFTCECGFRCLNTYDPLSFESVFPGYVIFKRKSKVRPSSIVSNIVYHSDITEVAYTSLWHVLNSIYYKTVRALIAPNAVVFDTKEDANKACIEIERVFQGKGFSVKKYSELMQQYNAAYLSAVQVRFVKNNVTRTTYAGELNNRFTVGTRENRNAVAKCAWFQTEKDAADAFKNELYQNPDAVYNREGLVIRLEYKERYCGR